MWLCEVKMKEVINLCNCKKLGYVSELDVNLCTGRIEAIIVPRTTSFCGIFGGDSCYLIPYECIKKIGDDLIFVEICEETCVVACKKC
ncbi:MAG: YlmC/YmxH family sporulation protein [Eubacteriales bacterium]